VAQVDEMRTDPTTPTTRLSDDMNHINPAHCTEALVQLMLGGMPVGRIGYPLHCRLRYFDPDTRRAGLPAGVARRTFGCPVFVSPAAPVFSCLAEHFPDVIPARRELPMRK
jgi:hypothetical protein